MHSLPSTSPNRRPIAVSPGYSDPTVAQATLGRAEKERDGLVEATLVPASRAACDSRLNYTLLVRLSPTLIDTCALLHDTPDPGNARDPLIRPP